MNKFIDDFLKAKTPEVLFEAQDNIAAKFGKVAKKVKRCGEDLRERLLSNYLSDLEKKLPAAMPQFDEWFAGCLVRSTWPHEEERESPNVEEIL